MKSIIQKTLLILCILSLGLFLFSGLKVSSAEEVVYTDGVPVKRFGSNDSVTVKEFKTKDTEFRAVWVSPLVGDIARYSSKAQYQEQILSVLDSMQYYNLNVMLFHVRIMNDSLYPSAYSDWSIYYDTNPDWDALPWIIEECHKRGIEFHAWMNPYRIKTKNDTKIDDILKQYENYPKNPAHYKENILYGTDMIIMDPGLENVRQFISDTIMEFFDQYDVEAIHFDDYFYSDLGAYGHTEGDKTIIDEPDQPTYNDYCEKYPGKYDNTSATDKANWRREQIDLLIQLLRKNINEYNKDHNKHIQFGISPTGVYKNGDGKVTYDENGNAISSGSDTNTQEHYASYLFCDTLKWCNEGWIDYILPQNYFARNNPNAPFGKVIDWWDKVLKNKKVNSYQGVGLYQADEEKRNRYSWQTDYFELYKDLQDGLYSSRTQGISIYNLHTLRSLRDGLDKISSKQIENGMKAWTKRVPLAEIKTFESIMLDAPKNVKFQNSILSFDKVEDAKFYIIYKNQEEIKFITDEIIDMLGNPENKTRVEWKDSKKGNYKYGVRALSYSNTLGNTTTDVEYLPDSNSSSKTNIGPFMALFLLIVLVF